MKIENAEINNTTINNDSTATIRTKKVDRLPLEIEDGVWTGIVKSEWENENSDNPVVVVFEGNLYIPKEVSDIDLEMSDLLDVYPDDIIVEEGNAIFCAKEHCLFMKENNTLFLLSKKSTIPADTKILGRGMLSHLLGKEFPFSVNPLILPEGLEEVRYRALDVVGEKDFHIVLPASLKHIEPMAFLFYIGAPNTAVIEFLGDPTPEIGAFGARNELQDITDEEFINLKNFVDIPMLCSHMETVTIIAGKDTKVAAYCKKYGIPCECR